MISKPIVMVAVVLMLAVTSQAEIIGDDVSVGVSIGAHSTSAYGITWSARQFSPSTNTVTEGAVAEFVTTTASDDRTIHEGFGSRALMMDINIENGTVQFDINTPNGWLRESGAAGPPTQTYIDITISGCDTVGPISSLTADPGNPTPTRGEFDVLSHTANSMTFRIDGEAYAGYWMVQFSNQTFLFDFEPEDPAAKIPEPATLSLLGLGALGFLVRRRRK